MATLRNSNLRRPAGPYNLPHQQYCADGDCRCDSAEMQSTEHNPETGDVGVRPFTKRIAPSLRFGAGELKAGLPATVLDCPEVAGAIERGELTVVG